MKSKERKDKDDEDRRRQRPKTDLGEGELFDYGKAKKKPKIVCEYLQFVTFLLDKSLVF